MNKLFNEAKIRSILSLGYLKALEDVEKVIPKKFEPLPIDSYENGFNQAIDEFKQAFKALKEGK